MEFGMIMIGLHFLDARTLLRLRALIALKPIIFVICLSKLLKPEQQAQKRPRQFDVRCFDAAANAFFELDRQMSVTKI